MADKPLTDRQKEALVTIYKAPDGWIRRGLCRIWGIAPSSMSALERQGYVYIASDRSRACLTEAGVHLVQQIMQRQS